MNTTPGVNEPRFDQRRITAALASDTHHLENVQAQHFQDDVQHNPSNGHCLCPTCHLKMAHFPRRQDGRILLPPPVPFHKGRNARGPPVPPHTQSEQLIRVEHCSVVDWNGSESMPRTALAPGMMRGKNRCSPPPQSSRSVSTTAAPRIERKKTNNSKRRSSSTAHSHATNPYPSVVQSKLQRYGGEGGELHLSVGRSSNNTTKQLAAPSDAPRFHERQPPAQLLEPLPQLGIASIQPRLNIPSEVSLERHGPALRTTSRTMVSSYCDALLPAGPSVGSGSRDEAVAPTPRPVSPPTERPPSRFFRFRPELFDQYVEASESHNVSIEATHMSYQETCGPQHDETSTGDLAAAIPEPCASQGARSPQSLSHIAHSRGLGVVSERLDIGALSFQKATGPPIQPAIAKAGPSSSRPKRNKSSDQDASGSAVQVKWDSERKRRQGYFAEDDGNEKSPFRHYNQTSCNFDS